MSARFPKAWAYLSRFETPLRRREATRSDDGKWVGPFADGQSWHALGRTQNLDKQHLRKLVVPRLVLHLAAAFDADGRVALDNVDVGGVLPADGTDPWVLLACLNGPICDFVFRRITKPFRGAYGSANRQFIEPLPIPRATPAEQARIAARAQRLQALHTRRRDLLARLARRLDGLPSRKRPASWLFAGLREATDLERDAPPKLDRRGKRDWAKAQHEAELARREEALRTALRVGDRLAAELVEGELRLLASNRVVLDRIFVTAAEAPFVLAQWRLHLSRLTVTEKLKGSRLANRLRDLAPADQPGVVEQSVEAAQDLAQCDAEIAQAEAEMNDDLAGLYGLSDAERALVAAG
jgi:hypothetical protein